ncbi:hotdog family protein [Comamonas resistens]|uniref:hypothetical protein n=1 Tax=Comamonas resistens TaxID=3046670 RepID=UPI0038991A8C
MSEKLYLEDLYVGQKFVSGGYPLDEAQIIAYARQFDPQVFHLDPEAAKHTFFHFTMTPAPNFAGLRRSPIQQVYQ